MPAPLPSLDWLAKVPLNELLESKKQLTESIKTWKGYIAEGQERHPNCMSYEESVKDYSLRLALVNKALDLRK